MNQSTPIYISAAHKSSGKTILTMGITSALMKMDYEVQCFKKGPDYIDPLWHSYTSNKPCYHLDFNTMSDEEIIKRYQQHAYFSHISLIEGNKGLYDGVDLKGADCNASLAKLLNAHVILVIDCKGITRGIIPLLLGYKAFDPKVNIAGLILNQVAGSRHEKKLRESISYYTDLNIFGAVAANKGLIIQERHLGLIPSHESKQRNNKINTIRHIIENSVDLKKIAQLGLATQTKQQSFIFPDSNKQQQKDSSEKSIKIAIFKDPAFGFYYPADLDALETEGAELIVVNALKDKKLPENIDAIFIGGGFPETHLVALEKNLSLRQEIFQAIDSGLPAYAECGGMMYLCRNIQWKKQQYQMVGIIAADVKMYQHPQGRGLVRYSETKQMPWPQLEQTAKKNNIKGKILKAHEFHYSRLKHIDKKLKFAYQIKRGVGITGTADGLIYKNLLASYIHLQDSEQHSWVKRFMHFVRSKK